MNSEYMHKESKIISDEFQDEYNDEEINDEDIDEETVYYSLPLKEQDNFIIQYRMTINSFEIILDLVEFNEEEENCEICVKLLKNLSKIHLDKGLELIKKRINLLNNKLLDTKSDFILIDLYNSIDI